MNCPGPEHESHQLCLLRRDLYGAALDERPPAPEPLLAARSWVALIDRELAELEQEFRERMDSHY